MPESRKILITGATGFVAGFLIPRLEADGHHLVLQGASRLPQEGPGRRVVRTGPFESFGDWGRLLDGVDMVINLAGRSRIAGETEDSYRAANQLGLERLMQAMAEYGVEHLVHVSSIAAKVLADEYGRTKKVGEQIVGEWASAGNRSAVTLRPPLIYGPGAPGNMARLVGLVRKGLPLPIGSVRNRRSLLAAANAADAIAMVTMAEHAAGHAMYELCDDDVVSLPDIVNAIGEGFGKRPVLLPFPVGILHRLMSVLQSGQAADGLFGSLVLENGSFKSRYSWTPGIRTLDGLRDMGRAARG